MPVGRSGRETEQELDVTAGPHEHAGTSRKIDVAFDRDRKLARERKLLREAGGRKRQHGKPRLGRCRLRQQEHSRPAVEERGIDRIFEQDQAKHPIRVRIRLHGALVQARGGRFVHRIGAHALVPRLEEPGETRHQARAVEVALAPAVHARQVRPWIVQQVRQSLPCEPAKEIRQARSCFRPIRHANDAEPHQQIADPRPVVNQVIDDEVIHQLPGELVLEVGGEFSVRGETRDRVQNGADTGEDSRDVAGVYTIGIAEDGEHLLDWCAQAIDRGRSHVEVPPEILEKVAQCSGRLECRVQRLQCDREFVSEHGRASREVQEVKSDRHEELRVGDLYGSRAGRQARFRARIEIENQSAGADQPVLGNGFWIGDGEHHHVELPRAEALQILPSGRQFHL